LVWTAPNIPTPIAENEMEVLCFCPPLWIKLRFCFQSRQLKTSNPRVERAYMEIWFFFSTLLY
jgi:hypothetical protein